jgi:phosphoglycolate phosphatase
VEVRPILKGIFFDLDGTLLNLPIDYGGMRRALSSFASSQGFTSDFAHILEEIDRGSSLLPRPGNARFVEGCFKIIGDYELKAAENPRMIEGADGVLEALKSEGLKIAVISRNSVKCAERSLSSLRLSGDVDLIVGRETTERTKPDPSPVIYALGALKLEPEQTIMVGDHEYDRMSAEGAGVPFVLFGQRPGVPRSARFVSHLSELLALI